MIDGLTILPLAEPLPDAGLPCGPRAAARLRHFVVDERNWCALAAVDAILAEHGSRTDDAHPAVVVLHGPSGVGKTHLAQGLVAAWSAAAASQGNARPGAALYVTGADFARRFMPSADQSTDDLGGESANAHPRASISAKRLPWQSVALLVLDNLDELADKESAQQQFVFVLDELTQCGAQIIVTSRTNPSRDGRYLPALRSRLAAGLAAPLKTLGPQGRYHVLEALALARGLSLSDESLQRLAHGCTGTVSQLAGALVELEALGRAAGRATSSIDDDAITACLRNRATVPIPLKSIAQRVCEFFRVKLADLRGPTRKQEIVAARSVAIYLSRTMTGESLQAIGRYFGGRDHATVLYNIAKVTEELTTGNPSTTQAVGQLRDALDSDRARFAALRGED